MKRNEVGVQLLSRSLHAQVFKGVFFPKPPASSIQISKEHLQMHGLDPSQGSVLPDTKFQLPMLQGDDISQHFHRIGMHASEPWLSNAKTLASVTLPPKPDNWQIQSGWTKYYHRADGSSYSEHVATPMHDGRSEEMLVFDVETMPKYHPYAIMACAVTPNAWYAWVSPWLLGETADPQQLIPLGDPAASRIVAGHNVSYDRIRLLEEYSLAATQNRFIDTMSLHVAVNGISSHQRPAWLKYRKNKELQKEQKDEAVEAVVEMMSSLEEQHLGESDGVKRHELEQLHRDMGESIDMLQAQADEDGSADISIGEDAAKRWEEITSTNSLAEVAKLHCGIEVDKAARNDLMELEPRQILENITDYLDYCAEDVSVTHQVYKVILPAFLTSCPHPVSFAGMLAMGSAFLPVDEKWDAYLEQADAVYNSMEVKVQDKLKQLAEDARRLAETDDESWKSDPWLSQLDWTPKAAGKSRGIYPPEDVCVLSLSRKVRPTHLFSAGFFADLF